MTPFRSTTPPGRVVFAPGAVAETGAEVGRLGLERVLVVASTSGRGIADRVATVLGQRCAGRFDRAVQHVPQEVVASAAALAREVGADGCVAVGGGSAIGLAKALALEVGVVVLAVPTTYAGSEMTPIWGRTDDGRKTTGRDPRVLPAAVLYDPDLSLGLPVPVSVPSGFNALAHALEGLAAPDRSPLTDLAAREGVRLMLGALPRIVDRPDEPEARADALAAAWLCGTVLGSTAMGLHHRVCHVLGGGWDLPHAETHAVLLPHVVDLLSDAAPAMPAALTAAGVDGAAGLQQLGRTLGLPASLGALGLPGDAAEAVADAVLERPVLHPRPVDRREVVALIRRAVNGSTVADQAA